MDYKTVKKKKTSHLTYLLKLFNLKQAVDLRSRRQIFEFDKAGKNRKIEPGCVSFQGIEVDNDGNIIVVDDKSSELVVFDKYGELVREMPLDFKDDSKAWAIAINEIKVKRKNRSTMKLAVSAYKNKPFVNIYEIDFTI